MTLKRFGKLVNKKLFILLSLSWSIVFIMNFQTAFMIQGLIIFTLLSLCTFLWEKGSTISSRDHKWLKDLALPALVISNETIRTVNPLAVQTFGKKPKELIGRSVFDLLTFDSGERKLNANSEIAQWTNEEGHLLEFELRITEMTKQGCFLIILIDRTEMKEQREKLQHLDQLSSLGELAAGIAHEIRNPITSLRGFLQLMNETNSSKEAYMGIMLSEIDRINMIVSELLLIAKPRGIVLREKNLCDIIRTVITLTSTQAILYNIQIQLKIEEISSDEILIKCDENKLKQVFINIIKNAIEAMGMEGEILISITRKNVKF